MKLSKNSMLQHCLSLNATDQHKSLKENMGRNNVLSLKVHSS